LVIDHFFPKGHCPVKMMPIQMLRAVYVVVSAPPFAKAIRARYHQAMQNGEKNGSLNIKFKASAYYQTLYCFLYPGFFP
jgi:hypothetical protein